MTTWTEQVTAIATAAIAIGTLSAIGAAIYAGRQVEEARIGRLVDRYELWRPTIDSMGGPAAYPLFDQLARKMRSSLATATA